MTSFKLNKQYQLIISLLNSGIPLVNNMLADPLTKSWISGDSLVPPYFAFTKFNFKSIDLRPNSIFSLVFTLFSAQPQDGYLFLLYCIFAGFE